MNTTGFIFINWPGPWIFPNTQLIANFTDLPGKVEAMKLFGWDWNSKSLRILKLMLRVLGFPGQVFLDNSSYVLHADETIVRYKALVRL